MDPSKLRARYRRIIFFFARVALGVIFWEIILPRLGLRRLSRRNRSERYTRIAKQFRLLAIRLGGLMIKVGQFLSSRLDVLPVEITEELAGLQDEVPAEEFAALREQAEVEFGAPLEEKYAWFDETPLAAASLGQAHRARLHPQDAETHGFSEVVVKIQRPFIEQIVEVDLKALRQVARWLEKYKPIRKRADVRALVEEFADTTYGEIDYLAEGRNAETFGANFKGHPRVHVPRVVWPRTTRRVLTLENVLAIKISDYDAITAAGIERGEVAKELLATYLQQIFEDGFFHADPHPGNLFITPLDGSDENGKRNWKLTFVDFGMVGHMADNLREGLRELILGIGLRDAGRIVQGYQTLNVLLPGADLKLIEMAEAQLFDRFWGKTMSELRQVDVAEMHRFALQFRELLYEMPFQIPQNLLMLGRTVAILSGMCAGLDPNFNLWEQITPYATKLIAEEGSSNWRAWLEEAGEILKVIVGLPGRTDRVLTQMERGNFAVQMPQVSRQMMHVEKAVNRLAGSLVFTGLLIGGALLYGSDPLLGRILMGLSGLPLLWTIFLARGHRPWP
jgi:predicted unusual protein kinase regulating ubiquinone biosynthesis (AarF/ABC1/UbiB family)